MSKIEPFAYRTKDGKGWLGHGVPVDDPENYIPLTEEQWNAHINELEAQAEQARIQAEQAQAEADRIFNLPENVAKRAKEAEIADLKAHLAETDYQAIKFAEGWITAEDYAVMKAQRQAWRDRINELEAELA